MIDEQTRDELNDELARALKALTEAVAKETLALHEQEYQLQREHQQEEQQEAQRLRELSLPERVVVRGLLALERSVRRIVTAIVR